MMTDAVIVVVMVAQSVLLARLSWVRRLAHGTTARALNEISASRRDIDRQRQFNAEVSERMERLKLAKKSPWETPASE